MSPADSLRVGFGRADSTPPLGTYLGGYARWPVSRSVRDRLLATAVCFERGGDVAVVLCVDLVFAHARFTERVRDAVRRALGVDGADVVVACSHSHSTPYGTPGDVGPRHHRRHVEGTIAALAQAAKLAWDARRPATLSVTRGRCTVGVNRRLPGPDGIAGFGWNDAGSNDHELQLVEARDADGARLGVLVSLPCHPVILSPKSTAVSADWVGEMRSRVEAELGVPCGYLQGACGDICPRHEWDAHDEEACVRTGARVAADVLAAASSGRAEVVTDGPVRVTSSEVPLDLVPETTTAGGPPLPYWHGVVRQVRLPKPLVDFLLWRSFPWATPVGRARGGGDTVALNVTVVRVGGLVFACHGSEPFHETGIAVRDTSALSAAADAQVVFVGYANAMIGYVPTPAAIPQRGYEVDIVPYLYRLPGRFAPTAEPTAVARTRALIDEVFG
ncbi:MAG: hypothetical protein H6698_05060 [Myxococcales bacterium]|nr:hypothetical protein [Myxococcales bacterium]MCB9519733.1 hypothetical protein [Myxococcales bacterium]MCB9530424.1 hypothetical protein [Myxococcales bacterium]MCB9533671.1 hypothetical protein [Myxococcales bacterium]